MFPLCIDLDGTLCKSDLLWESLLSILRRKPWLLLLTPIWLLKGRAFLKQQLSRHARIDISLLPYRMDFVGFLSRQKEQGRPLFLVTASDQSLADGVARHLGIFDGVLASNGMNNLKGRHKAAALTEKFGPKQFDYAGDSLADLPVWQAANRAILVNVKPAVERLAAKSGNISDEYTGSAKSFPPPLLKALRVHQWAKNLLVFIPLFTAHLFADLASISSALIAFAAFGLAASSVYLLNDLLDIEADRAHPRKRNRPFASGNLHLAWGLLLAPLLAMLGLLLAFTLGKLFTLALLGYLALTLAYSYYLKRLVMVDVIALASLYTLRIIAGAVAIQVDPSHWLLVFSLFLFTSLALVKRHAELADMRDNGRNAASGRAYVASDLEQISSLGASSGYLSVLTLALYVHTESANALYRHPQFLWVFVLILLYWISRVWLLAHRRQIHEDPIVFALKDRVSYILVLISLGAVLAAI